MSNQRGRGGFPQGGYTRREQSPGGDSGFYTSSGRSTSGQSVSTSKVATKLTQHATERMYERNLSEYEIKATLKHGLQVPGRSEEKLIKRYGLNEVVFVNGTRVEDSDQAAPVKVVTCYRHKLTGVWKDGRGMTLAVRNDNSFFGGLRMSDSGKGFTLVFGNFEKDSLKSGGRGEHHLDLITFDFAPNSEVKTRSTTAVIKVDTRFGLDQAVTTIGTVSSNLNRISPSCILTLRGGGPL